MSDLTLSPVTATLFVLVLVFAGRQFRVNWKRQDDGWKGRAWTYGLLAALSFALLAFVPLGR